MAARGPAPSGCQLSGAHDSPVGQDDLETGHHVLDLPVAGGVCPRREHAIDPPMVARATDWGQCPIVFPCTAKLLFEIVPEGAGQDIDKRGRRVSLQHALQAAAIETYTAEHGDRTAADATASAGGCDGNARFVAAPQHVCDFCGAGRPGDHARPGGAASSPLRITPTVISRFTRLDASSSVAHRASLTSLAARSSSPSTEHQ